MLHLTIMEPTTPASGAPRAISWEAPEHHHVEKGNDWFFALAIIILALVIVAVLFDNVLFALLIGLAGGALGVSAAKRPAIVPSYNIDEDDPRGPQLLVKSQQRFLPLIVMPIPVDHVDDIEDILKERLEEEELVEPFLVKILELFGF